MWVCGITKIVQKDIPIFRLGQAPKRVHNSIHVEGILVIFCGANMPNLHFKKLRKLILQTVFFQGCLYIRKNLRRIFYGIIFKGIVDYMTGG